MRAWCNGSLVDPAAPAIAPLDHGVTVGDGVFEAIKVTNGLPFALTRHLRRLARSATGLGLPEPDQDLLRTAVAEVLAGEPIELGRIRITFTGGIGPLGSGRSNGSPSYLVVVTDANEARSTTKAVTVPWTRNEQGALVGLKTTSYAENVMALAYAEERDATEAIFANTRGQLCEGTGTNVFCVFDGLVVTPPLDAGCLAGITRELVIEWADVDERALTMSELAEADEVFLTSTTRDVQGLHQLDERTFAPEQPVTAQLQALWQANEPRDIDP
ncbi:MAG: aminotransferase class IV [Propionibacteriales bacterium]|nr:aminotransferase class IV [Propionibacteriales bacterium]